MTIALEWSMSIYGNIQYLLNINMSGLLLNLKNFRK